MKRRRNSLCRPLLALAGMLVAAAVGAGGLATLTPGATATGAEAGLLPPEQAFPAAWFAVDRKVIVGRFSPAPGHYLYRDRLHFKLVAPAGARVAAVELPAATVKKDPLFGETRVYAAPFEARLRLALPPGSRQVTLEAAWQGCNGVQGVCYPPIRKTVEVSLP